MNTKEAFEKRAFIFRIKEYKKRSVELALKHDKLYAGWSKINLTDSNLTFDDFKSQIQKTFYKKGEERRVSVNAGNIWRFINEMNEGDYVIVPHHSSFYVCQVLGSAEYVEEAIAYDAAHQRSVKWLNNKQPIPRVRAAAKLQLRMKARQTCIRAFDLVDEIERTLKEDSTFNEELQDKLVTITQKEIVMGKMNDWDFEKLIKTILTNLTKGEVDIIPRQLDKGVDIIAKISIADIGEYTLAVQVKHHDPTVGFTDTKAIDQLIEGMLFEGADIGWLVSSGKFSDSMYDYKNAKEDEEGLKIDLIDGKDLAEIIIRNGIAIIQ